MSHNSLASQCYSETYSLPAIVIFQRLTVSAADDVRALDGLRAPAVSVLCNGPLLDSFPVAGQAAYYP